MKLRNALAWLGLLAVLVYPRWTPGYAQETPGRTEPVDSLDRDYQDFSKRLDALENNAAPVETPVPVSDKDIYGNHKGAGLHDIYVPMEEGNEYLTDESRKMEISDGTGNAAFRIGGFVYTEFLHYYGPSSQYLLNDVGTTPATINGGSKPNEFDGFMVRKVHLDFGGNFDKVWGMSFALETDHSVGNNLGFYHAFLYAKLDKDFVIKAGKFSNVVSLEGLQSNADMLMLENSMVLDLLPDKELGVMATGKVDHLFDYALALTNGAQDNVSSSITPLQPDEGLKEIEGRVFFTPFKKTKDPFEKDWLQGLGFGLGASADNEAQVPHSYGSDSQPWTGLETSLGSNHFISYASGVYAQGGFYHWDPQLYYYNGSFGLQAEYVASIQTVGYDNATPVQLTNTAWSLQGSWVFGGQASYEGAQIDNPFDLEKGGLGALELAVRVDQLNVDVNSFTTTFNFNPGGQALALGPQVATALTLGVNWHLDRHFKWMFNWARTDFSGGNLSVTPEELWVIRGALVL